MSVHPAFDDYVAPIHDLEEVKSTSDLAMEGLVSGAVHGELYIAAQQRQGRGRLGRRWYSPAGGHLIMSVVLRPRWRPELLNQITLAAGVAAAEGLEAVCGLVTALKWPNDVMVGGRKLGGVLCESVMTGDRTEQLDGVVVGIGANLVGTISELPEAIRATATTIENEQGVAPDRHVVAAEVAGRLLALLVGEPDDAASKVRERWRLWAGLPAPVQLADGRSGEATDIDERGYLSVRCGTEQLTVQSVTWLR